jgi:uncharacterized membrane protein YhdT
MIDVDFAPDKLAAVAVAAVAQGMTIPEFVAWCVTTYLHGNVAADHELWNARRVVPR